MSISSLTEDPTASCIIQLMMLVIKQCQKKTTLATAEVFSLQQITRQFGKEESI